MQPFNNEREAYAWCTVEGMFKPQEEVDAERIKANLRIAEEDLESGKDSLKKKRWNSAYKTYYDVLHLLVEAFLRFDKVKSKNHQCLFAYLCVRHPELELEWGFFEKVRTKRNGINYYGSLVMMKDWKEAELQMNLYLNLLKEEIKKRLQVS